METEIKKPLLFTNRALVTLTVPIVLEALLAILAGMVDTAMVSAAGEAAVSAVSLVDSINLLFITMFAAIANGGAVVTSQYIGNNSIEKAKCSANQLLYASTAIAMVFMTALLCCIPQLLRLVYGSVDADVFENCRKYFLYTLLGYPFFAVGNSCTALLRSMAKSRVALFIAVSANVFNVVGNAVLIYGFDMGVTGAAIATTLSRVFWAAAGMAVLLKKSMPVYFEKLLRFRVDWDIMRRVMKIGMTNGLENGLFQVGKLLVSSLISSFGTVYIAAYSVAYTISSVGWNTVGSLGSALLTVTGMCMGAGEPSQAKMYTKKISNFGMLMVLVLFGGIFLLRGQLVKLFSFGPEALEASAYYTGVSVLCTVFSLYSWSFVPMNSFRAAGDVKYAVTLSVSAMFIFRVALSYLLGGVLKMGLIGVWIGMWANWVCHTVFNIIHYRRGKWLTKKVI